MRFVLSLTIDMWLIILFFPSYKEKVRDYNFGSLIRTDARGEYGEKNTIFGELRSLAAVLYANS